MKSDTKTSNGEQLIETETWSLAIPKGLKPRTQWPGEKIDWDDPQVIAQPLNRHPIPLFGADEADAKLKSELESRFKKILQERQEWVEGEATIENGQVVEITIYDALGWGAYRDNNPNWEVCGTRPIRFAPKGED